MQTVGIICEYNPFHLGHEYHIEKTKLKLGGDVGIVCVMSGNFVQRGDFAIFGKHARAKMAVLCGADLVIELPTPYALSSSRDFARAGVFLLDALGVCDYISFGSESGRLRELIRAARAIASDEAEECIREALGRGLSYATAQQIAADTVLGERSHIFEQPNNILGIEYIKALSAYGCKMEPLVIRRTGGEHDGEAGLSASSVRCSLAKGNIPLEKMPGAAVAVCLEEFAQGREAVLTENMEQAILARLRAVEDFSNVFGASDGLDRRFMNAAAQAPTVAALLENVKTKRHAMSRIRRVMLCAVLGIRFDDVSTLPPYIRVLAMNERGMAILKSAEETASLPILIKPAAVNKMDEQAVKMFSLESRVTDFYTLAFDKAEDRTGGSEWRKSPVVV